MDGRIVVRLTIACFLAFAAAGTSWAWQAEGDDGPPTLPETEVEADPVAPTDDAFDPTDATLEELAALRMPIQLVAGSSTTRSALGVVKVLRGIWPDAAYAEIAGAGHMSPLTHADRVNEIIERFLEKHAERRQSASRVRPLSADS